MHNSRWMLAMTTALMLMAQGAVAAPAKKANTKGSATFDPVLLIPEALKAKAPDTFQAKFSTTRGEFTVRVTRAWAPLGADRFYNLVRNHFYDNASFFRVIPGFMAQFGLSAYPAVTAVWRNNYFNDDFVTQTNTRGRVSFATKGPNTRTTQLFINTGDNARLDDMGFAAFGEVDKAGMAIVDAINSEYSETPNQRLIENMGQSYLETNFPRLDKINTATIVGEAPTGKKAGKKGK